MHQPVPDFSKAVLDIVGLIPPGKVLAYGEIAEILEQGGPRQVGAVMAAAGSGAPWWRVVRADGRPPRGLERAAVEHYLEEGTALKTPAGALPGDPAQFRVNLERSRWNPSRPEQDALQAIHLRIEPGDVAVRAELSERDGEVAP